MHIVLFGATGHTGGYILQELLKAGFEVTVLVRQPKKLRLEHARLHLVAGDALNEEDVRKVVKGKHAVVSAISEGPDIQLKTQSRATANIISAMKETGVERIICMGAIGILQHNETELIRDQPFYDALYKPVSLEHSEANKLLAGSGLVWTQVCPPTILGVTADGDFTVSTDYPPSATMEVNAGNIGLFIAEELRRNEFKGKRVGIANGNPKQ